MTESRLPDLMDMFSKHQNLGGNLMYQTTSKVIKNKVGLLNLAEELGNVSRACKVMGYSRDTFYRYQSAVEAGGVESLFEKSRRQESVHLCDS